MDRDTITALTIALGVYRRLRQMGVYDMPLEFKGIKANTLRLMANHGKLNAALAEAVETSDKLISHVSDFKSQSAAAIDDIEFAANVLGNSNGSGSPEQAVDLPNPAPAIQQPEQPKTNPAPNAGSQEVGQQAAPHFQPEV